MSRVILIAADKPLPPCDRQEPRTTTVNLPNHPDLGDKRGGNIRITCQRGFRVEELAYYRSAVDDLGYSMKDHRYELDLDLCQTDLEHLRTYLSVNLTPGDEVELWNLWLGMEREADPVHFRGTLADFDLDTLDQLLNLPMKEDNLGQCRMTVLI